jgi:hypothetical protein
MLMSAQREDWVIAIERAGLALAALARQENRRYAHCPPDQHKDTAIPPDAPHIICIPSISSFFLILGFTFLAAVWL